MSIIQFTWHHNVSGSVIGYRITLCYITSFCLTLLVFEKFCQSLILGSMSRAADFFFFPFLLRICFGIEFCLSRCHRQQWFWMFKVVEKGRGLIFFMGLYRSSLFIFFLPIYSAVLQCNGVMIFFFFRLIVSHVKGQFCCCGVMCNLHVCSTLRSNLRSSVLASHVEISCKM